MLARVAFTAAGLAEALAFCARAPVGHFHDSQRRRMLTALTSAPEGTFILADAEGLALVATVVDVIAEPATPAELVVLGARADIPPDVFAELVLSPVLSFSRRGGRPTVQVARPTFLQEGIDRVLSDAGFAHSSDCFTMRRAGARLDGPPLAPPAGWRWLPMEEALVAPSHAALIETFREASVTLTPPLAEFRRNVFADVPGWRLLVDGPTVAGLVRLSVEGAEGAVRILGRLPAYRGRGLGRLMLDHGLRLLDALQVEEVNLEVEAANDRALGLYRAFDFEVVERTPYYRSAG